MANRNNNQKKFEKSSGYEWRDESRNSNNNDSKNYNNRNNNSNNHSNNNNNNYFNNKNYFPYKPRNDNNNGSQNDKYKQNNNYNNNSFNNRNDKNNTSNTNQNNSFKPFNRDYRTNQPSRLTRGSNQAYQNNNEDNRHTQVRREYNTKNPKGVVIQFKIDAQVITIHNTKQMILECLNKTDFDSLKVEIKQTDDNAQVIYSNDANSINKVINCLYELKNDENNCIYRISKYFEKFNEEKHKKLIEDLQSKFNKSISKSKTDLQQLMVKINNAKNELRSTYKDQYELLEKQIKVFETFFNKLVAELNDYLRLEYRCNKKDGQVINDIKELSLDFETELLKFEAKLPLYGYKNDIFDGIDKTQVFILKAETGSGKSTQIPQYLAQLKDFKNRIVCTQPRRIAAISLAKQVSTEMLEKKVGQKVGYSIGQHARMNSKKTKILYMTDAKFLNEILEDKKLKKYSFVIVDEAHERGVHSELLISMLKDCLRERKNDFKIFISSATISTHIFEDYFKEFSVKVLDVPGRLYPVELIYCPSNQSVEDTIADTERVEFMEDSDDDMLFDELMDSLISNLKEKQKPVVEEDDNYLISIIEKTVSLAQETTQGDILVFLTGVSEIEDACIEFQNRLYEPDKYLVLQLHGSMNPDEQIAAFKEYKNKDDVRIRKIIFSTNVAETSITLEHVEYIIDSGKQKCMRFDDINDINILEVGNISKSSADQRKGRAGRTKPGKCYRMYSKKDYEKMEPIQLSEIKRINLQKSMLNLMDMRVKDAVNFDYIEKPPIENLKKAFNKLIQLNAIKSTNNPNNIYEAEITEIGRLIARLPFEPHLSLFVINAINRSSKYLLEVIALVALLSQTDMFYRSCIEEEKDFSNVCRTYFSDIDGDAITLLNVLSMYLKINPEERDDWCRKHSLNFRSMRSVFNQIFEAVEAYNKSVLSNNKKLKFASATENDMNELGKTFEKQLIKDVGVFDEIRVDDGCKNEITEIWFQTFKENNICHYTGVSSIYFSPRLNEFIRVFPTQTLSLTHHYPEYICFERILLTGSKHLIGVQNMTMFLSDPMNAKIKEDARKWMQTHSICEIENLGDCIIRQLIGRNGSNLRRTEKEIFQTFQVKCHCNIDRYTKSFKIIHPNLLMTNTLRVHVMKNIDNCIQRTVNKSLTIPLSSNMDTITFLAAGGQIMDVTKFSNNTVIIKTLNNTVPNQQKISQKFEQFGTIKRIVKLENEHDVALLEYENPASVMKAINNSLKWNDYQAVLPEKNSQQQEQTSMYETSLELSWDRRKRKNVAFIKFDNTNLKNLLNAVTSGPFIINNATVPIRLSKYGDEIQAYNIPFAIPSIKESDIKLAFENRFQIYGMSVDKVNFGYDSSFITSKTDFNDMKKQLNEIIIRTNLIKRNQYTIDMLHPKDTFTRWKAVIQLKLQSNVLNEFCKSLCTNSYSLPYFEIIYKTNIKISRPIYNIFIEEINAIIKNSKKILNIQIKSYTKDVNINLESPRFDTIEAIRDQILNSIKCEKINLHGKSPDFFRKLETKIFKRTINKIIMDTKTYIEYDKFIRLIKIYGKGNDTNVALEKLNAYLLNLDDKKIEAIVLNHFLPPKILFNMQLSFFQKAKITIKYIFENFGSTFDKLLSKPKDDEPPMSQILFDLSENLLLFEGTGEDYEVIINGLNKMRKALNASNSDMADKISCSNGKNCRLLATRYEEKNLTNLELSVCGHTMCSLCFNEKFENETQLVLPLKCNQCDENGNNLIISEDLLKLCTKEQFDILIWNALKKYADNNQDKYYKCPNTKCLMIHELNSNTRYVTCQYCN